MWKLVHWNLVEASYGAVKLLFSECWTDFYESFESCVKRGSERDNARCSLSGSDKRFDNLSWFLSHLSRPAILSLGGFNWTLSWSECESWIKRLKRKLFLKLFREVIFIYTYTFYFIFFVNISDFIRRNYIGKLFKALGKTGACTIYNLT